MKSTNKNILNTTKVRNNPNRDEFYTTKETAEQLYKNISPEHFANKIIYCNADGPESEIYQYWKRNFKSFNIKKLIATKYVKDGNGLKTIFNGEQEIIANLNSDGSYDSDECLKILNECDIVTTNPPFSKLDDYIPRMLQANKDIITICNMMCLMHKSIREYTFSGILKYCTRFSPGGKFTRSEYGCYNGDIAEVHCIGVTTLETFNKAKLDKFTFEQLKAKNKVVYTDDGILECKQMRILPIDYYDEIYCPMSILMLPMFRKYFDILDLKHDVKVNGKNRFWRIKIKRNNKKIED